MATTASWSRAAGAGGRSRGSLPTARASAGWRRRSSGSPSRGGLEALRRGVAGARERLAWEHTVADYGELVGRLG